MQQFPAVLVTGPRQAGKTTFLLHEAGEKFSYVSFDDPLERSFAAADPNGFLNRFNDYPVILDEIQYAPDLLSYLKLRIDEDRHLNGRWILTGSQQFHLMQNVSESLAGILDASYLLWLLPPFYNNLGKRITKAPKLYMLDPAIVCYLTRQPGGEAAPLPEPWQAASLSP